RHWQEPRPPSISSFANVIVSSPAAESVSTGPQRRHERCSRHGTRGGERAVTSGCTYVGSTAPNEPSLPAPPRRVPRQAVRLSVVPVSTSRCSSVRAARLPSRPCAPPVPLAPSAAPVCS
ncbi:uncharacterized protein TRAVEDRAFT_26666, partial [Trametes versicolor FP-101664 SS1]|uniref:uncharacterized protein n=1 Tax=Trametes versicolor (strain FP-101664) TaxID=717944 RepID=UPI000462136A